ncbi:hypothetical protein AAEX28_03795 [Lentisphaerota bacterium WC36G]|nr:hypothetical protein LJT99_06670 [Lentisphaerae bacterium WC36]
MKKALLKILCFIAISQATGVLANVSSYKSLTTGISNYNCRYKACNNQINITEDICEEDARVVTMFIFLIVIAAVINASYLQFIKKNQSYHQ